MLIINKEIRFNPIAIPKCFYKFSVLFIPHGTNFACNKEITVSFHVFLTQI